MDGTAAAAGILIVEDEVDLADTCVRFLRRFGHRLRVAHTAAEAMAAIDTEPPDLLIADLRLPGGPDGFAVIDHARRRDSRVAVIVCTAQVSDGVRREAMAAGVSEYLPKPFTLAQLRAAVDRALGPGPPGAISVRP
jgi:DNA-binding response OmpR family regulator